MCQLILQSGCLQIAVNACAASMGKIKKVHFILSEDAVYETFEDAARKFTTSARNVTTSELLATLAKPWPTPDPNGDPKDSEQSGPVDVALDSAGGHAIKAREGGAVDVAGKVFGPGGESASGAQTSSLVNPKITVAASSQINVHMKLSVHLRD
jgi:hypothetical protein